MPSRSPWWRPRTLSKQLVYGVAALVTVVTLGGGALSVYSLHTYVTTMSDAEVTHSLAAFEHSVEKYRALPSTDDDDPLTDFTGQAPGTLIAVLQGNSVVNSAIFSDEDTEPAPRRRSRRSKRRAGARTNRRRSSSTDSAATA